MKTCNTCGEIKAITEFYTSKNARDGYRSKCKVCVRIVHKEYKLAHPEKCREDSKKYSDRHPEKRKAYREKVKDKYRDYHRVYEYNRKKTDVNYKLMHNLRGRVRHAVKRGQKSGSAVRDLGCSIEEFKQYIEAKFQEGMTWDNWSHKGWHIDHIIPLSSFDLTDREQFLKACHFTNMQPLWAIDNIKKSDKLS